MNNTIMFSYILHTYFCVIIFVNHNYNIEQYFFFVKNATLHGTRTVDNQHRSPAPALPVLPIRYAIRIGGGAKIHVEWTLKKKKKKSTINRKCTWKCKFLDTK